MIPFFYPERCWHCNQPTTSLLCAACSLDITFCEPPPLEVTPVVYAWATCLVHTEVTHSLLRSLSSHPFLGKPLASLLWLKFLMLSWSQPDFILPSRNYRFPWSGYCPNYLLAQELSRWMDVPLANSKTSLRYKKILLVKDHLVDLKAMTQEVWQWHTKAPLAIYYVTLSFDPLLL